MVERERENMPFCCLGRTDCDGMMERGNEVGSGYASTCLLRKAEIVPLAGDMGLCTAMLPFERTIRPSSSFYPFLITRDSNGRKSSRYISSRIDGVLL